MNFSSLSWLPTSIYDDDTDDWFGGGALVTPRPLGVECVRPTNDPLVDDPAIDWIPV